MATADSKSTPLTDDEIAENFPALLPLVRTLGDIYPRTPSPELAQLVKALEDYFRTRD